MGTNSDAENFSKSNKNFLELCFDKLKLVVLVIFMLVSGLFLYITSPIWFFLLLCSNAEAAATFFYNAAPHKEFREVHDFKTGLEYVWCKVSAMFCYTWRYLWYPVILILPMATRHFFIDRQPYDLNTFATQTQMDYVLYRLKNKPDETYDIPVSDSAFLALWDKNEEQDRLLFRKAWASSGKDLKDEQINGLIRDDTEGATALLLKYFTVQTRRDEQLKLLLDHADNTRIIELIDKICRAQKPTPGFIETLFTSHHEKLQQQIIPVIDEWADINAVSPGKEKNGKKDEAEEMKAWTTFCTCKKEICTAAQMKMKQWQYEIFAKTGHHLSTPALKHLIATLEPTEFLAYIIDHEGIDKVEEACVFAILKSRRKCYEVYMEKKNALQKAHQAA